VETCLEIPFSGMSFHVTVQFVFVECFEVTKFTLNAPVVVVTLTQVRFQSIYHTKASSTKLTDVVPPLQVLDFLK
jgi:hypothetical protein